MRRLILLFACLLTLAACGGGSPADPAEVEVSGAFGEAPDVTVPDGDPSDELYVRVLQEGAGEPTAEGDLLVVDYHGQTWAERDGAENVFDNSFAEGRTPIAFNLGGNVVAGWNQGLVGKTAGSRVLVVIPPELAYADQERDTIPAGSTLVFVVDILQRFGSGVRAESVPVEGLPAALPAVTDAGDTMPTVSIPAGLQPPTGEPALTVIRTGAGDEIGDRQSVVLNIIRVDWDGTLVAQTWDGVPESVPIAGIIGLTDALQGQRIGTRIVVTIPANTTATPPTEAGVLVLDVVGAF